MFVFLRDHFEDFYGFRNDLTPAYYFIAGQGQFTINDQVALIEAGLTVYVQPGGEQFLENTGDVDMEFLCLVDPAWREEDETVLE